jgi:HlyD family secretion protein
MRIITSLVILVGIIGGGAAIYSKFVGGETTYNYRTAQVRRGDLAITVNATGTLEPEVSVDIGAQVSGPILKLGDDPRGETDPAFKGKRIDYTTPVEEGTVLAIIDPATYQAQYDQASASLQNAQANLGQLKAKRTQAEADWNRAQLLKNIKLPNLSPTGTRLGGSGMEPIKAISDSDYDLAVSNYEVAKANVDVGVAQVVQAEAQEKLARANLGYTKIVSPIKGTILARRVDVGQTVVGTFNAQSLFLIAKDLSRLQVWSSVNEADIGRIHLGMPVTYQVEAFPGEQFHGTVEQIRLNAQQTQNVVLYTVVVAAPNPDLKLLPYLTADPVKFEVDRHENILLVPNAALRWQPKPDQIAPDARDAPKSDDSSGDAQPETASAEKADAAKADSKADSATAEKSDSDQSKAPAKGEGKKHRKETQRATLWIKDGNFVRPIEVRRGLNDDQETEVSGDALQDGMEIVTGENRAVDQSAEETNPFAPRFFRNNRPGQGGLGGQKGPGGPGGGGQGAGAKGAK